MYLTKIREKIIFKSHLLSLLVIFSTVSCDGGCHKELHTYEDIAISVDKQILAGNTQKKFVVSLSNVDKQAYKLLEDFELKVEVIHGKVAYSAYKNGVLKQETASNLTKDLTHFFSLLELKGQGSANTSQDIEFAIQPDEGRVQVTVYIELFKKDGENKQRKGGPYVVTWNQAEEEIKFEFNGIVDGEKFKNNNSIYFTISNKGNGKISTEDILIKLISKDGNDMGAAFTLNGKSVDSTGKSLQEILHAPSAPVATILEKGQSTTAITLVLENHNNKTASEVTLEMLCGTKTARIFLNWQKSETTKKQQEQAVKQAAEERLRKERTLKLKEERLKLEGRRLKLKEEKLKEKEERLKAEERRLRTQEEKIEELEKKVKAAEEINKLEEEIKSAEVKDERVEAEREK